MEYGTAVSVWCKGTLTLSGDEVVFCREGINFNYDYRPACVDPSKSKIDSSPMAMLILTIILQN